VPDCVVFLMDQRVTTVAALLVKTGEAVDDVTIANPVIIPRLPAETDAGTVTVCPLPAAKRPTVRTTSLPWSVVVPPLVPANVTPAGSASRT
jgi:hypothetical protein